MKPAALKAGDTIALVSPASPLSPASIEFMVNLLTTEGYKTVIGPNAFMRDDYLAGTDAERAADLDWAFSDPSIQGIMCTRGGYGAARLLSLLDLDMMAASRKLFCGFSDITTLHLALNARGLPTLHSPMAITLSNPKEAWVYESLLSSLKGENPIPATAPVGTCVVGGESEGVVTGGCLCLITDSLSTPNTIDCAGKIVVIEDVDENPHRIDAMLTHLCNAGEIQQSAGIVIGEMTRTDERVDEGIGGKPWRDIVVDRLGDLGIPMIIDFPFGHAKNQLSLPLGIRARLNADAGRLEYTEALCS
jgi:muramoyltetrapeptide carboxypeptidase